MMTATTWCLGSTVVTRRGRSNSLPNQTLDSDCLSRLALRIVAFQAFEMPNYRTRLSRSSRTDVAVPAMNSGVQPSPIY
jgi:hypothetical protein